MRRLCRLFGVSPSGFYASQTRPESKRAQEDRRLKVLRHASFTGGRGYYGSPRIHDDVIEWGERVSRERIIRLKQEEGLQARVRKRYTGTTDSDHDQPVADNLLRQDFTAARPKQRWVGDTSELRIGDQGKAYLAVILDLCSRFVVGWAVCAVNDRHLTIKALEMALKRRAPDLGFRTLTPGRPTLHIANRGAWRQAPYPRTRTGRLDRRPRLGNSSGLVRGSLSLIVTDRHGRLATLLPDLVETGFHRRRTSALEKNVLRGFPMLRSFLPDRS